MTKGSDGHEGTQPKLSCPGAAGGFGVSSPMAEGDALKTTKKMDALHLWIDYHTHIRPKKCWLLGKRWDCVNWWRRDGESADRAKAGSALQPKASSWLTSH